MYCNIVGSRVKTDENIIFIDQYKQTQIFNRKLSIHLKLESLKLVTV